MPKMFIGTDDLPFALTSPVTTGGTSTAYTLTDSRIGTPADGQVFAFRVHTLSGTNPTLSVNGDTARNLKYRAWSGSLTNLTAQYLSADQICLAVYRSATTDFEVLVGSLIHPGQIPSTLNATTFAGNVSLTGGMAVIADMFLNYTTGYITIRNFDNTHYNYFCGGSSTAQSAGAYIALEGSGYTSGNARYYCSNATGAKHQFFDKNGAEQLRVDENGVTFSNLAISANTFYRVNNSGFTAVYGGTDYTSAVIRLSGSGDTYPGAHQSFAPLTTRAASTAFAVCPVATGDVAKVQIFDDTAASSGAIVRVDSAGTVTFDYPTDTKYVNTSSPGAAEIGVYISAGVLYAKPGTSITPKLAHFDLIGKA